MVSRQLVEELRTILKKEYRREFTLAEATDIARCWVGYFDLLAKIHHRSNDNSRGDSSPAITPVAD